MGLECKNCDCCPYAYCKARQKEGYEHFQMLVYENSRSLYYIKTDGTGYRIDKKTKKRTELMFGVKDGKPRTYIHGLGSPFLKTLVWKVAKVCVPKGYDIVCVDGNEMNCSIENLMLKSHAEVGRITGPKSRSRAVIVTKDGKKTRYRSVREAAKSLYVCYQTLSDWLNGKTNERSCLYGMDVRYANRKWGKPR